MGATPGENSFISKSSYIQYSNLYLILNGQMIRQVIVFKAFLFIYLEFGIRKIPLRFFMNEGHLLDEIHCKKSTFPWSSITFLLQKTELKTNHCFLQNKRWGGVEEKASKSLQSPQSNQSEVCTGNKSAIRKLISFSCLEKQTTEKWAKIGTFHGDVQIHSFISFLDLLYSKVSLKEKGSSSPVDFQFMLVWGCCRGPPVLRLGWQDFQQGLQLFT